MVLWSPKQIVKERLLRYATRLRFPKLLALSGLVFILDLIFPDVIPFVDEILLGLITMLLASLKKTKNPLSDRRENHGKKSTHSDF